MDIRQTRGSDGGNYEDHCGFVCDSGGRVVLSSRQVGPTQ
jgi:hypothetical protein